MNLQLVVDGICTFGQIRHGHDVYYHTGPAGKVLCSLPIAGFGAVLLPCETSLLPLPEHILN